VTIGEWLEAASADARRRGLDEIVPLLDALAGATEQLRAADWNVPADGPTPADEGEA
jgi:hypothetical protein